MVDMVPELLNRLVAPLSFMVPLLMIMGALGKRAHSHLRVLGSIVAFGICFKMLRILQPNVEEAWSSPTGILLLLLIYASVLLLLVLMTLFCCNIPFTQAFFCAGAVYTTQNLSFVIGAIAKENLSSGPSQGFGSLFSWVSIAIGAIVIYLLFVCRIGEEGFEVVTSKGAVIAISAALFFNIVFNEVCNGISTYDIRPMQQLALRISQAGLCVLILYMEYELLLNRRFQIEAATTNQLIRDRERQYETSREAIDAINLKCHDIRHQIRRLGGDRLVDSNTLDEIALAVNVYDAQIDSGNKSLDTILTEKSLLCDSLGIEFTCSADGSKLSFLTDAELFSLFGNMLDNAIEATRDLDDETMRVITLGVHLYAGLVTVHEENYFAGRIDLVDGMPQSTKHDPLNHGYGFRSMRAIVEKHDGAIECTANDNAFCLDIAIPLPRA